MPEQPKGPTSYFPSIEQRYGRSIGEWMEVMKAGGRTGHKDLVDWLKTEHGLGHGHANALAAYYLNPGKWPAYVSGA